MYKKSRDTVKCQEVRECPPQRKGQTHCDGDALKGHRDQQKGLRRPKWEKSEQENIISNYNPNNKINIHEFMIISKINK